MTAINFHQLSVLEHTFNWKCKGDVAAHRPLFFSLRPLSNFGMFPTVAKQYARQDRLSEILLTEPVYYKRRSPNHLKEPLLW